MPTSPRHLPRYIAETLGLDVTDLLAPRDSDRTRINDRVRDAIADTDTVWDLLRPWAESELSPWVKILRSALVSYRETYSELAHAHAAIARKLESGSYGSIAESAIRAEVAEARIQTLTGVAQSLTETLRDNRTATPSTDRAFVSYLDNPNATRPNA